MKHRCALLLSLIIGFIPCYTTFAKITKGPYLNQPQQTSMRIMWESDIRERAMVKYGRTSDLTNSVQVAAFDSSHGLYLYQAALTDLEPRTRYYYQVTTSDDESGTSTFRTSPDEHSPIRFAVVGDTRTGHETYQKIAAAIESLSPDFVINMGDLVSRGGNFNEWEPHFFQPAAALINHIPLISTLGDHDNSIDNGVNFNYYFRFAKTHEHLWFSYDYGPAHFVSLDYRAEDDSAMIAWFEQDMAQSDAQWKIVYLHRPSYNLGGHRTHWGREVWPTLYRKHKVDLVFAGHSHMFERFYPLRPSDEPDAWPVTYITTGGAGAELYESVEHEFLARTASVNHFILIDIRADSLLLHAYRPDLSILDQVTLVKDNGHYDSSYLQLVKPQEVMDVHMTFASELLLRFNQKPTATEPAVKEISFKSTGLKEDVIFRITLAEESAQTYRMEPIEGVLQKGNKFEGLVKLFAKKPYRIDGRYFVPPVIFNAHYQTASFSGVAKGRQSRCYPTE